MYEDELERIVREDREKLEYYAFTITEDYDLAAEAVQYALIEVWRVLHKFDPSKSSLFSWVVQYVLRRAPTFTEARPFLGRRAHHYSLQDLYGKDAADPVRGEAREVLTVDVHTAIEALPASLRWIAGESLVKKTPISDLSATSGIHKRVLWKWLARARGILRERLKEYK